MQFNVTTITENSLKYNIVHKIAKILVLILLFILPYTDSLVSFNEYGRGGETVYSQILRTMLLVVFIVSLLGNLNNFIKVVYNKVSFALLIFIIYLSVHIIISYESFSDLNALVKVLYGPIGFLFFYNLSYNGSYTEKDNRNTFLILSVILCVSIFSFIATRGTLKSTGLIGLADNRGYAILACFPSLLLFLNSKKALFFISAVVCIMGVIAATKRGAILSLLLILPWVLLYLFRAENISRIQKNWMAIYMLIGGILLSIFLNNYIDIAFSRISNLAVDHGSGRDMIYKMYWDGWLNHSTILEMIFGHGLHAGVKDFKYALLAHNDWFEMLYCYGIFGIGLFINLLVQFAKYLYRLKDTNELHFIIFGLLVFIYFIKTVISGVFFADINNILIYIQMAYILAVNDKLSINQA